MLELVPPTPDQNRRVVEEPPKPLTTNALSVSAKKDEENLSDIEDSPLKQDTRKRTTTHITMNFHNVSAPITMFNSSRSGYPPFNPPFNPTFVPTFQPNSTTQAHTPFQFSCQVDELPSPEEVTEFERMEAEHKSLKGTQDDMLSMDSADWKMLTWEESQK